ncbi:phosphatidylglycerol:prolipoprotein diacylglycerol transferase [Arsukibacterium tuosuense]|uniref:Phosphatidylglycerol--prolipoprotein diacylglyceryl transferase n=1 Tax=Arsukibacterium tuosuense TaxID=1323745 RepID=A0A285J6K0_9GAMM|nr:prolipoprotein diacylglyceryl transferase [Arsukibacterium tuosuense]SNY55848.1 phosphatidylglycerol:prolipoprotein diacylglycerol transferase [Arsukibacterium tuosuense]
MTSSYLDFPDIDPVLVSIGPLFGYGPLNIHWYGVMYAVAFGLAYWLANRAAAKPGSGWTKEQVSDLLFFGFLGVIVGGRLGYVFFYNFGQLLAEPLYLFKTWEGGMSFHGGLLGVLLAMAWFARRYHKSYLQLGDFVAPLIPLGLAAGRLGNFINGELWGRTTDVPWAVMFPNAGSLPRHPSQLYHVLLEGILLFIIIMLVRRLKPATGTVGGVFLLGYGVFRFFVEFFRQPDAHLGVLSAGMTMGQWLCLPMIAAGLGLIIYVNSKPAVSVRGRK